MNPRQAFCTMVHEYGVGKLAGVLDMNRDTLQNKANPNSASHQPSLHDAWQAALHSGSPLLAVAFAQIAGGVFLPTSKLSDKSTPELYKAVHDLAREFGDVPRRIDEAMKDGRISPSEAAKIEREIFDLVEHAAVVGKRVQMMAEPTALRVAK